MSQTRESGMVATVVEPGERRLVDAASGHRCATVHVDSVRDALRAVRTRAVSAVLVSPRCVVREQLPELEILTGSFPGLPTVAVLSSYDAQSGQRLLELGSCGIRRLLDLSRREGWDELRELLAHPATPIAARILSAVVPALDAPTAPCRLFFVALVRLAPVVTTVRALTARLGVPPSTFVSRFFRAGLPSPKRYLAAVRLVYAAALLESPARSLADAAYQLEYSSPQSFGRHVRGTLGLTAHEFRRRFTFQKALAEFVSRLIVPFQRTFRTFHPLPNGVGGSGRDW